MTPVASQSLLYFFSVTHLLILLAACFYSPRCLVVLGFLLKMYTMLSKPLVQESNRMYFYLCTHSAGNLTNNIPTIHISFFVSFECLSAVLLMYEAYSFWVFQVLCIDLLFVFLRNQCIPFGVSSDNGIFEVSKSQILSETRKNLSGKSDDPVYREIAGISVRSNNAILQ